MIDRNSTARAAVLACCLSGAVAPPVHAEVGMPAVFGDHMVLQQRTDVPIWGWADAGETVRITASWLGDSITARPDTEGRWRVTVATPEAGGPHRLTVTGDANTLDFRDILMGEVWICSGQSNMEWPMSASDPGTPEDLPEVRLYDVPHRTALQPERVGEGSWTACTPESARGFSAVAYYFGKRLHEELGVPIGLMSINWGGTPVEAWTSYPALRGRSDFAETMAWIEASRANPAIVARERRDAINGWWKQIDEIDPGVASEWGRGGDEGAVWTPVRMPDRWGDDALRDFDGVVWYRRTIELAEPWVQELVLELGPIDDMDDVRVNGILVAGTREPGRWREPRRYRIPSSVLKAGPNVLSVRVLDTGGEGAFTGRPEQLKLRLAAAATAPAISLVGEWERSKSVAMSDLPAFPSFRQVNAHTPTALFNGMIAPVVPFALRGAIWYQGESNRTRALQYAEIFPLMIEDWRRQWNRGAFPFYFVQIAPFGYGGDTGQAALLRDAQRLALRVPNTGMAVTMDVGDPRDIHPRDKLTVGNRLAGWALARTYGRTDIEYSGPLYRAMAVEGDRIRLTFDHADGLRASGGSTLTHFTIAGEDRRFVSATARIDGDSIVVSAEGVSRPRAVRYGWGAADEPNLENGGRAAGVELQDGQLGLSEVASPGHSKLRPTTVQSSARARPPANCVRASTSAVTSSAGVVPAGSTSMARSIPNISPSGPGCSAIPSVKRTRRDPDAIVYVAGAIVISSVTPSGTDPPPRARSTCEPPSCRIAYPWPASIANSSRDAGS